jgi:hypothetical protein
MPQIGKGALYPSVTPGSILLRHAHNQGSDLFSGWASSQFSRRTPIVFVGDQFSMPRQQCFWCNDGRHHREQFATERLRFRGQSTPLIVTKPATADSRFVLAKRDSPPSDIR